jgi:hypothetical protein
MESIQNAFLVAIQRGDDWGLMTDQTINVTSVKSEMNTIQNCNDLKIGLFDTQQSQL